MNLASTIQQLVPRCRHYELAVANAAKSPEMLT
jgi:hypothetical protein